MTPCSHLLPATTRRIAALILLASTLAACSAPPAAPSAVEQPSGNAPVINERTQLTATSRTVDVFALVNGTFTMSLRADDGSTGIVRGVYTGESRSSGHGTPTATLKINITSVSGVGATITAIEASGMRAFVSEGDFALALTLTSSLNKSPLRATIKGVSSVSCSDSHRILVAMHGTDETKRGLLEVTIDLRHEVEQTGCS